MSERGTFCLDRGWFDHPAFKAEPCTEREAWAWLIAEAAYRPRRRRVGSFEVQLARGQVAASLRFMAGKWQWSEARVRRFLTRLKTDAMIDAATDAGMTVITICNYDRYQYGSKKADAAIDARPDAEATQERRNTEEIKKERNIDKDGGGGGDRASAMECDVREVEQLRRLFCQAISVDPDSPEWAGKGHWLVMLKNRGFADQTILSAALSVMDSWSENRLPPPKYFEKAIETAHARFTAPLPTVVIEQQENVIHVAPRRQRPGSISAAIDRLEANLPQPAPRRANPIDDAVASIRADLRSRDARRPDRIGDAVQRIRDRLRAADGAEADDEARVVEILPPLKGVP